MSNNNKYNYSVIIPHKNIPDLLQRCLDSIPRRKDIQIIVVDDNSNLTKKEFESFPGINDPYIEILFTKEAKGPGIARNKGLEIATGKWILFADADDFFNQGAFDKIYKYIHSEYDIVYFSANSIIINTSKSGNRGTSINKMILDYLNNSNNEDDLRYKHFVPWGKIIRNDLIRKYSIKFDEGRMSEDIMFSAKTGHYAKKIAVDTFQAYCITVRDNSLISTKDRDKQISRYKAIIRLNKFFESINRSDLNLRMITLLLESLNYGPNEFIKYLNIAIRNKINPFEGLGMWIKVVLTKKTGSYASHFKSANNISQPNQRQPRLIPKGHHRYRR